MIVIEIPTEPGRLPSVVELSAPDFLRLGIIEAFRAGDPIPTSIDEAAAYLRHYHPNLWPFHSAEAADLWAEQFPGPHSGAVRFAVRSFMAAIHNPKREVFHV